MESAERKTRILRKSHVFTKYTSTSSNGREYPLTKGAINSTYQFDNTDASLDTENLNLEDHGFSIVDDKTPTFDHVSPKEVSEFYKSLGEWQNVLPKTDYTYSPASRFYRQKINGTIPVIPNMSRRDIWKNGEIIDNEINLYCSKNYRYDEHNIRQSSLGEKSRRWLSEKLSTLTKTTPVIIRNTYLKNVRRYKRFRWSHHDQKSSTPLAPSSSSHTNSNTWRKLLLVAFIGFLLYFLASSGSFFRTHTVPDEFFHVENLVQPFVKIFSWFYSLVVSFYERTYSSITFLLSMISLCGKCVFDFVYAATFTPIYKFVFLLWSSYSTVEDSYSTDTETEPPRSDINVENIEQLFRQFLDENTAKLIKNVVSSEDFSSFINNMLKNLEEKQNDRFEELSHKFDKFETIFERKLSRLEGKIVQVQPDVVNDFKKQVLILREEIKSKESQIETEIIVLLTALVELEKGSSFDNLKHKFSSLFLSIESAHVKIDKLSRNLAEHVKNASDMFDSTFERSKDELKHDLRLSVEEMVAKKLQMWKKTLADSNKVKVEQRIDDLEEYVKHVVNKALEIYDADKTGQADFALESQGGIILSTRCTETKTANAQFSILGIPLWHTSRSPRTVIQPGVHPGECWAFPGSTGYLVIQLSEQIIITGFTLEHIPRSLAANGTIDSAPKDFSMWALRWESDPEPKLLGTFRYEVDGPSLQYFEAVRLPEPYQVVELKILSNHGKIDYTCLYRLRVHGIPA